MLVENLARNANAGKQTDLQCSTAVLLMKSVTLSLFGSFISTGSEAKHLAGFAPYLGINRSQ